MLPTPHDRSRPPESLPHVSEATTYAERLALAAAMHSIPEELFLLAKDDTSSLLGSEPSIPEETDQTHSFASVLSAMQKLQAPKPE